MYDVIVVGARCAGSPLAMLLARQGYRILLVDRGSFPSDTLSTHYLQRSGVARLKAWGLLDQLRATGCPPIRKLTLDYGSVTLTGHPSPADELAEGYAPRRKIFDQILVDAAVEAGAELRDNFAVQELLRAGDRVVGIRGRHKGGAPVAERARLVIGADGMRSGLARAVQAPCYHTKPALTFVYYTYWSGIALDGFETYKCNRRTILALPTHDGLACIAVFGPPEDFPEFRTNLAENYLKALELAPGLAERVRSGQRAERFMGTADLPNFFRRSHGPGWALVGDAGHHKDPISGQGISAAFHAVELLAKALDDGFSERRPLDEALAEYERQRDSAVLESYEATCQMTAMKPLPAKALEFLAALSENQPHVDQFLRIGKGVKSSEFYAAENLQRMLGADRFARLFAKPQVARA